MRTCLLWILGWAAGACAVFFLLRAIRYDDEHIWWASGIAGFCIGTAAGFVIGVRGLAREVRALSTPPRDGEWSAVSGVIRSSAPLRAPISGVESVAYEYKVTYEDRSTSESSTLIYYDGKALAPCTIGDVRLLAVPFLDVPHAKVDRTRAIENAKRYIASTTFAAHKGTNAESANDTGAYRFDRESHGGPEAIEECDFEEKHIKQGETVCVFGLYSRQRGGVVPHPNWAKPATIIIGTGAQVAEKLRKRMRNWSIAAACLTLVAIAAVGVYLIFAE